MQPPNAIRPPPHRQLRPRSSPIRWLASPGFQLLGRGVLGPSADQDDEGPMETSKAAVSILPPVLI
jgi:hypothetical protein